MRKRPLEQQTSGLRAEMIMKVRCGLITASQAAERLGVSRRIYYKWEQRGLNALLDGLADRPALPADEQRPDSERKLSAAINKQADFDKDRYSEFHKALIENISEGIAAFDERRHMFFCNRAYYSLTGYDDSEINKCFDLEYIHSEDHENTASIFRDIFSNSNATSITEYRLRHKKGHWIWLETHASNMLEIPGIHAVVFRSREITERKKFDIYLKRMHNILLESQKISNFGSFEYIAATEELVWSDEEFRIYGLDPAKGSPDYEDLLQNHIHPDDADRLDRIFREAFSKGEIYNLVHKIVRPDGTVRIVHNVAHAYFDDDGNLYKYIGTTHDITELKKIEEHLQKAQKLEAIGTLAGGIAHDFNNMLAVFIGNISYALSTLNKDDELFKILSDALEGTNQARSLTQQLLTFAKGGKPIKEPSNINKLLKETAQFVTSGAKSKCEFSLADDLWTAAVDSGQFNQVISNIVINADQAMPNGGIIKIQSENTDVETNNDLRLIGGPYIKISIEDQGIGISEEHLLNIFDPYFTTKKKGSGLGLATVYSIVKNHAGQITAYSEIGKGTVFNIYIPASPGDVKNAAVE